MSSKFSSEDPQQELSWEEAVGRYLEQNPDYFARYPDTLAALNVPHPDHGQAVSLIERQVKVLREKRDSLSRQLRELVSIARENDVLADRLHQFALAMIDCGSLEDVIGTARDMLRQQFKLDAVGIHLSGGAQGQVAHAEFIEVEDPRLDAVLKQFAVNDRARARRPKPIAGGAQDSETLAYLFGDAARDIRSTALVMIPVKDVRGLLSLGSRDPLRFDAQMATTYLSKLGELLAAAMGRFL